MPTGAPDYTKRIDINIQTLGEVTIRPRYGDFKKIYESVILDAGVWTEIISVSGRGLIYGGYITIWDIGATGSDAMRITIDGETTDAAYFAGLMDRQLVLPFTNPFYLLQYDENQPQFTVGISRDISFESAVTIEVKAAGPSVRATCEFFYGLL